MLRDYDQDIRRRVLADYGDNRMSDVTTAGLQRLVDELGGQGLSPSVVGNAVNPVRALYRDASRVAPGWSLQDPTDGLRLPSRRSSRRSDDRMPTPEQVAALVAAAPAADRAIWALAGWAGLRLGEIQALRWRDLNFKRGEVHVRRSHDRITETAGATKSYAGERDLPMFRPLRVHLEALTPAKPDALVFLGARGGAFAPATVQKRATAAWEAAGVERFTFHECRHGAASVFIEAKLSPRRVQTWMGHSKFSTTFDLYGKLLDRSEPASVAAVDAYLAGVAVGPSVGPPGADEGGLEREAA